jgi:hypothetical protein
MRTIRSCLLRSLLACTVLLKALVPVPARAVAVHLIMLHTGKVLFFRGDQSVPTGYVWDPATEAVVPP